MIVIICGPPAVGKTTVGRLLRERLDAEGLAVDLVDSDEFATNTYDRLYDRVVDAENHVVVAGTFYKRQWQERFRQLDDLVIVYLRANTETCLERNRERSQPIAERAIHIICAEFDDPDAEITVDVTERSPQDVVNLIRSELPEHTAVVQ